MSAVTARRRPPGPRREQSRGSWRPPVSLSTWRSMSPTQRSDSDVVEQSKTTLVVIDLWAPWCGPCQTLGPILEKVTDATQGKVVLAKVNIDENPAISQAFRCSRSRLSSR